MRSLSVFRRHQIKLYPNKSQHEMLETWDGHCRFVWNICLEQRKLHWSRTKKRYPNFYDQCPELAELRNTECQWLQATPVMVLGSTIQNLQQACRRMFKKEAGCPRFKKKNLCSSSSGMTINCGGNEIQNGFLRFPYIGLVRFRGLKQNKIPGKLKSFNLKKVAGDWFASLLFEVEEKKNESESIVEEVHKCTSVGIDRGITHLLAMSDGTLVENPRWYRTVEKKLKREQRRLSRKKKGSNRRKKQQLRLARAYRRVRNVRNDFLHKLTTKIAKNHGIVILENLRIENMIKLSSGMAKSILDAGWGTLQRMLSYKCREVVLVNPAYTSQTCHACGHVCAESRSGKEFFCVECGHRDDADVNAAKNILKIRNYDPRSEGDCSWREFH